MSVVGTVLDVIKQGAFCEDATGGAANVARYTTHFYDPAHNGTGLHGTATSSLDWGLETTDMATQDYSYNDAKNYLYKGLTLPAKADRGTNLALTFRTLGHVMHLVQDLAQPQHTRNDSHGAGSLYEHYTDGKSVREALPFGGYSPVQFTTPNQLWHTVDGNGLADYSNRGFVGAGTNLRGSFNSILPATNYPLPNGTGADVQKKQIADSDMLGGHRVKPNADRRDTFHQHARILGRNGVWVGSCPLIRHWMRAARRTDSRSRCNMAAQPRRFPDTTLQRRVGARSRINGCIAVQYHHVAARTDRHHARVSHVYVERGNGGDHY